ncbi:hypothetical protein VOLCADRAFT_119158, partial [Volvox carteri f. nagariensis]
LGLLPNREVYNILLAGLAKSRPLPELLGFYNEMVRGCLRTTIPVRGSDAAAGGGGTAAVEIPPGAVRQPPLTPDHYTFNALLTAAAHHMTDLATLDRIRREMARVGCLHAAADDDDVLRATTRQM